MDFSKLASYADIISKILKFLSNLFGNKSKTDSKSSKIDISQDKNTNIDDLKKFNKRIKEFK